MAPNSPQAFSHEDLVGIGRRVAEGCFDHSMNIRLQHDGVSTLLPVKMHIRTRHPMLDPYGDDEFRDPIDHTISLAPYDGWVADEVEQAEFEALARHLGLPVGGERTSRYQPAGDGSGDHTLPLLPLEVARVHIVEITSPIHAPRYGWFDSLDPIDEPMADLGTWMETVEQRADRGDGDFAETEVPIRWPAGGSIFYCHELFAHPAAAGQELGLHVLCRGVSYLTRHSSDIAVLQPIAIPNKLDPGYDSEAEFTAELKEGLISYYQRAGFEVDEQYREETGMCYMYSSFLNDHTATERHYWSFNEQPKKKLATKRKAKKRKA
jgi:hypothetical protein